VFESRVESYVTTDGQSVTVSWNKAPIWGLRQGVYYCQTAAGLLTWGALSDEKTGLTLTIVAGPRQRSHSWVRVPRDSQPHFTVSDSRLPFSLSPTTRSATVEISDPTSTRDGVCENHTKDINTLSVQNAEFWCVKSGGTYCQVIG
jgi:hypothetical protein